MKIIFILAVNLHVSFPKTFTKKMRVTSILVEVEVAIDFYLNLLPEMVSVDVMFEGMLLQYAEVVTSEHDRAEFLV